MTARELLRRFLLQQMEAGETELFLDGLDADAVFSLLSVAASHSVPAGDPRRTTASAPESAAPEGLLQALAAHAPDVLGAGTSGVTTRTTTPAQPAAEPSVATEAAPHPSQLRSGRDPTALRILGEEVAACRDCTLHESRQHVVFGEGNAAAEVVIVGEAPGSEEDRTGRPFVGPAGKLLDLLLLTAGFQREDVYICNVLKCRPPGNRDPGPAEVAACSAHLRRQLDAIQPTVLLAVGKFAAQTLARSNESIGALRGGVHSYEGIPLVVTYHPAFLLRSPQWTRAAWEDLQLVREVLERRRLGS